MRNPLANFLTRLATNLPSLVTPLWRNETAPMPGARYRVRRRFSAVAVPLPLTTTAARIPVTLLPTAILSIHPATPLDGRRIYATIVGNAFEIAAADAERVARSAHLVELSPRQLRAYCLLE